MSAPVPPDGAARTVMDAGLALRAADARPTHAPGVDTGGVTCGTAAPAGGIEVRRLGRRAYDETLALQVQLQDAVIAGGHECLLLVEHPPVVTLGRGADPRHVLEPLRAPVVRVNRGGDVTYHGPGQLVGYPIIDLGRSRRDIHRYLRALEAVLIGVAARFGITAGRRPGLTGVWVGNDKLAAIGVGIRRWVTMHGFAINVADLRADFAGIVPCGIVGAGVTSLEALTGVRPAMREVEDAVIGEFMPLFRDGVRT